MYRIWTRLYEDGALVSSAVSTTLYARKDRAERTAERLYGGDHVSVDGHPLYFKYKVSTDNPWNEEEDNMNDIDRLLLQYHEYRKTHDATLNEYIYMLASKYCPNCPVDDDGAPGCGHCNAIYRLIES